MLLLSFLDYKDALHALFVCIYSFYVFQSKEAEKKKFFFQRDRKESLSISKIVSLLKKEVVGDVKM